MSIPEYAPLVAQGVPSSAPLYLPPIREEGRKIEGESVLLRAQFFESPEVPLRSASGSLRSVEVAEPFDAANSPHPNPLPEGEGTRKTFSQGEGARTTLSQGEGMALALFSSETAGEPFPIDNPFSIDNQSPLSLWERAGVRGALLLTILYLAGCFTMLVIFLRQVLLCRRWLAAATPVKSEEVLTLFETCCRQMKVKTWLVV